MSAHDTPEVGSGETVGERACGADFSRVMAHLEDGIREHADRDGLTGVLRAVFMDRGGHAPGETCPTALPTDPHDYWCQWPDDECECTR